MNTSESSVYEIRPQAVGAVRRITPFPHVRIQQALTPQVADRVLHWLSKEAPWRLRVESFYEQYELGLIANPPPNDLAELISPGFIDAWRAIIHRGFRTNVDLELVSVAAHKLVPGQTINVHSDYVSGNETYRALIQLNTGWRPEMGGALMIYASHNPEDIRDQILPIHGSGFIFEVSPVSFHAVAPILDGERYTLVYSFRHTPPRAMFDEFETRAV